MSNQSILHNQWLKVMSKMKKNLIVSAVRKVKDKVVVHYTDGTVKEFTIPEWEYSYGQGRRLWEQHEKDFKNPENFDG
jgi:hypothetical protein